MLVLTDDGFADVNEEGAIDWSAKISKVEMVDFLNWFLNDGTYLTNECRTQLEEKLIVLERMVEFEKLGIPYVDPVIISLGWDGNV